MQQIYSRTSSQFDNQQVFLGVVASADPASPLIYNVPTTAHYLHIICIGGGAAGGGGGASAAATASGGGRGGGSSGVTTMWVPTFVLPKVLYVFPGVGGLGGSGQVQGGSASTNGGDAFFSRVCLTPYGNATGNNSNFLIQSGTAPTGGAAGSGATAGTTLGAAGSASSASGMQFGAGYATIFLAGLAATNGGSAAAGTNGTYSGNSNIITMSGTGGGGTNAGTTNAAGGSIPAVGNIVMAIAGGLAGGGRGQDGISCLNQSFAAPFYNTGGAGGGSNTSAGVGGAGGNGGPGCGGGGGGGSNGTASVGGAGGNGGPGLIIITAF